MQRRVVEACSPESFFLQEHIQGQHRGTRHRSTGTSLEHQSNREQAWSQV